MNYKDVILVVSALLGLITIFLIGTRYKENQHTNIYLIAIFLLNSIRFLFNGIPDFSEQTNIKRQLDLLYFVSISPVAFLYFKKSINHEKSSTKIDFYHFFLPAILFLVINNFISASLDIKELKIRTSILIFFNLFYVVKSYFILKKSVWNRNSEILVKSQQNVFVKKWSCLLFGFLILIFLIYFLNLLLLKTQFWFHYTSEFLLFSGIMWTFLYLKVIYSPEFLYGYDMFQNKIKEYNKHKIIFDNIWSTKTIIPVTNLQDKRLKEIIEGEIDNYILCIEKLALNKDLYFSESFKIQDLSFKLDIPKSHITYVFKYHSKISFNDFKKIIRIKKVIHLIDDGYLKNNTFDALANETGFASYSAFFKTFKNSMGISPKEYYVIRQQKLQ